MAGYLLSEADRNALKSLLDNYQAIIALTEKVSEEGSDTPQAPDVYVAYTPSGGIPGRGRTGYTGSASGTAYHQDLGSAECQVWTNDDRGTLVRVPGLTLTVYNLMDLAIPANSPILIHRSKFGKWYASPAMGLFIGTLASNVSQYGYVYVNVHKRSLSGVNEDTGIDIVAYDWMLTSSQTLALGTHVICGYDSLSGVFWVVNATCQT
jgi:hypothetical protein